MPSADTWHSWAALLLLLLLLLRRRREAEERAHEDARSVRARSESLLHQLGGGDLNSDEPLRIGSHQWPGGALDKKHIFSTHPQQGVQQRSPPASVPPADSHSQR
ncbi:hypothetical protein GN956_G14301 [Arapaima gigas]